MKIWKKAAHVNAFPLDMGSCVKFGDKQIAIFHFERDEWYAVENRCPHQKQMVLSRGLIGDCKGEPKVVCPLHKHGFSLKNGRHLGGDERMCLSTFPVRRDGDFIFVQMEDPGHC